LYSADNELLYNSELSYGGVFEGDISEMADNLMCLTDVVSNQSIEIYYRWWYVFHTPEGRRDKKYTDDSRWFTTREGCLEDARRNKPDYTTWDGPGAPYLKLMIEERELREAYCHYEANTSSGGYFKTSTPT
jgi:hypothetical protein